jgi:hypothetical protein
MEIASRFKNGVKIAPISYPLAITFILKCRQMGKNLIEVSKQKSSPSTRMMVRKMHAPKNAIAIYVPDFYTANY